MVTPAALTDKCVLAAAGSTLDLHPGLPSCLLPCCLRLQASISLQISSRVGRVVFTAVVASGCFALVACARVSNQPFRVTLQVGCWCMHSLALTWQLL
jgi:hypothetical protein